MSAREATVLERIVAETRVEVARRKLQAPLARASREAAGHASSSLDGGEAARGERRSLRDALGAPGIGVIAEFKRRSPSAGELRPGAEVRELARAYERGGAVALSVLTERANFDGSLADLSVAREACRLPLLRKDFIVDRYQLHEALLAGADAVLLIVAALSQADLRALHGEATGIGLDVLVEVHDHEELERALGAGAALVGINNRDLRDFSVDVERTFQLLDAVPDGVGVVSESGIADAGLMRRLDDAGVQGALVGELLMRASDPQATLSGLISFRSAQQPL
ncbi:MAG TPA: indole-3-glycerol phosphate synthase TrpC [Solirubrobacteraceae bacterium]|nr:indole-3-glycerol phosphate synthase TrpC [Solirubrobacteraceae bacterium]